MTTHEIRHLTDEDFHQAIRSAETPVIVDFWSPWCMPCRVLAPLIEDAAKKYAGRVEFFKVNVQECPRVAAEFKVSAIPMLMAFREGKVVGGLVGLHNPHSIEQLVESALEA